MAFQSIKVVGIDVSGNPHTLIDEDYSGGHLQGFARSDSGYQARDYRKLWLCADPVRTELRKSKRKRTYEQLVVES